MNRGEQLLRGSGMAQQAAFSLKPYEWRGRPGWDPAKIGPVEGAVQRPHPGVKQAQARMAERLAEFCRLRGEDVSVQDAGRAVGVSADRARKYENMRKAGAA